MPRSLSLGETPAGCSPNDCATSGQSWTGSRVNVKPRVVASDLSPRQWGSEAVVGAGSSHRRAGGGSAEFWLTYTTSPASWHRVRGRAETAMPRSLLGFRPVRRRDRQSWLEATITTAQRIGAVTAAPVVVVLNACPPVAAMRTKQPKRSPARVSKCARCGSVKHVGAYVTPDVSRRLRVIAAQADTSVQALIVEGIEAGISVAGRLEWSNVGTVVTGSPAYSGARRSATECHPSGRHSPAPGHLLA